jgi:CDP-4-dehydro-6-deoxyglucose reductase
MALVRFEGLDYPCGEGESVLECLERHGVPMMSSCRSGACQSCMMRATSGDPGDTAKQGLKDTLKAQDYFLACVCRPTVDLTVTRADAAGLRIRGRIIEKSLLNERTVRLRYAPEGRTEYRAGQFMNLVGPGGDVRSYSLASVPGVDEFLEFHIMAFPGGKVSGWAMMHAQVGDESEMLGPQGACFYVPGRSDQPLVLIGTGTGLAPLSGIVRDALAQGHAGPIRLYHGALRRQSLYLVEELRALSASHANFTYVPCVLHPDGADTGLRAGDIQQIVLSEEGPFRGKRVFLCGDPNFVRTLQRAVFKAGAGLKDILADAFLPSQANAART